MKKVLVAGILFLAATLTIFAKDNKRNSERSERDHSKRYEYLSQKLNLNEQQVESIKKIDEAHFAKLQEQRKQQQELREKNLAVRKQMQEERDEQIKKIMTEDQYKEYAEMKAKTKERSSHKQKGHHGGKRHHRNG